jgi:hypothetical protein
MIRKSDGSELDGQQPEAVRSLNMSTHLRDWLAFAAVLSLAATASAASTNLLVDFEFNEGSGTRITDSINSLVGTPGNPSNPPTFITDSPSGQAGDTAVQFENGQYFQVNDPTTRIQFDTNSPSFTLEAWVKLPEGNPSGRMVFFYSNGKGGAVSFSVNSDRTVFVTTLGRADLPSAAAIPDDGAWHHIAVSYDDAAQELNFYVDGELGDTQSYTSGVFLNRSTAQPIFGVGAEWNGALRYTGALDRLKVHRGVLPPAQLDSRAIPAGGAAQLTFASPTATPLGFSMTVNQIGGALADTNSIALSLNNANVVPSTVTQSSSTTIITYNVPTTPFPSGSTNAVNLVLKDTKGTTYTNNANFVVATYATLPADALVTADTSKRGFKIRTYQLEAPSDQGTVSTIAYNENLLAGNFGANVANTSDPVAGNADINGFFTWPGVINFNADPSRADGYFTPPDFEQSTFPGLPGITDSNENFAQEILTALTFPSPGVYTMAVVTDWTGFPDQDDGFQLRAGANPTNAASSVVIGFFDSAAPEGPGRGAANSPLQFYVPRAGSYPFRLMYYQSTGGAQLEWVLVNSDGTRSLVNDTNSISGYYAWTAAPSAPDLSVARSAGGITLTFAGTLQSADTISADGRPSGDAASAGMSF